MKIRPPTIPRTLSSIDDLKKTLLEDKLLEGVEVTDGDVSEVKFKTVRITDCRLQTVDFLQTHFEKLTVSDTIFKRCSLIACDFGDSDWSYVQLTGNQCSGAQFQVAAMKDVVFDDCKLDLTNFRSASLTNVRFENCTFNDTDFYGAKLTNVAFADCRIDKIEFSTAELKNVDLTSSQIGILQGMESMKGAKISSIQLASLAPYFAQALGIEVEN